MGTNYYLEYNKCSKCGRTDTLHIGNSSAGWKFMFHKIQGKAENYSQWLDLLLKGKIFDEYGRYIPLQDFLNKVQAKQKDSAQLYEGMELIDGYNFMEGEFS